MGHGGSGVQRFTVELLASIPQVSLEGVFYRHAALNRDAFAGGRHGRWGADFPVIYLGRPEAAAVAEAYRHLVEANGVPARAVKPRVLYTVRVSAQSILDVTGAANLDRVGMTVDDLSTEVDDYQRCQEVAAAARQLGHHGVLAPAAHGLGQTLALFKESLSHPELPVVVGQITWDTLPADPRIPRVLRTRPQAQAD